ncbi:MAG: PEP-CTERM sorting domain-containing protein [Armatimonadetes bacterium]|nr:PEP-CTERM sorting domain-containing protein [Armatimonadota bacterium]
MKSLFWRGALAAVSLAGAATGSAVELLTNGSFENNHAVGTVYNNSNSEFEALVPAVYAFGTSSEVDLMDWADTYGPKPSSGNWKIALHAKVSTPDVDAISFDLKTPIVGGKDYNVSFDAAYITAYDPNGGPIQVGVSNNAHSFGTLVFTGVPTLGTWTTLAGTFQAPSDGYYLTVRNDPGVPGSWVHLDNFHLSVVPEPATLAILSLGALLTLKKRTAK